ncbi:MAG: bifunctional riboflavin kinase/FAD synthetase [Actinomycetia bacterium]|nr:bifunctional riboflavin kinase/FAD synthetase [Actinomycetes bacterium]
MKTYYGFKELNKKSAVAIGAFDGIHLGHQEIIKRTVEIAGKNNLISVLITFDPDPEEVIKNKKRILLTNLEKKLDLVKSLGIEKVIILPFNAEFMRMTAEDFIDKIIKYIDPKWIIIGKGFRFGYDQKGDHSFLKTMGDKYSFQAEEVSLLSFGGEIISSTKIRKHLINGEIEKAEKLLGYPYKVRGKVVKGKGVGKETGFPTANLKVDSRLAVPAKGVYSGFIKFNKKEKKCAIYIGTSPTMKINEFQIEAHIPGEDIDLLKKEVTLVFKKRIREEKTFKNTEELTKQITSDLKKI